jgi:hypothetical protein
MTPLGDVYEKTAGAVWTPRGNIAGPQGVPGQSGGLEIVSYQGLTPNTGGTGVTGTGNGDALITFPAASYRAVPHYFEMTVQPNSNAGNQAICFRLHDGTAPGPLVGQEMTTMCPVTNPGNPVTLRLQFTPTAGVHTYQIRWRAPAAGTYFLAQTQTPTVARIVEAALGSVPLISPPLVQGPTTLPTADYPGQRMTYWLASNAIYGDRPQSAKHWDMVWNPTAWWYIGGPTMRKVSNADMTGWSPPSTWIPSPQPSITVPEKGIYMARASWEATCSVVTSFSITTRSRIASVVTQSAYQTDSGVPLAGNYVVGDMDWHPLGASASGSVIDKGSLVDIVIWGGRSDIAFRYLTLEVVPIYITN